MLKALIIGADAVSPEYIFGNMESYPNIANLVEQGVSASYSSYVQKGYRGSYLSEMNWASIYTGLEPQKHRILYSDGVKQVKKAEMTSFTDLEAFWKILNSNGMTVGMWSGLCCENPVELNGYAVSTKCESINEPQENRISPRKLQTCKKDENIFSYIKGIVPPRVYPLTVTQQGYDYDTLKKDEKLAWEAVEKYHFQESLDNFREELDFYFNAIKIVQKEKPVDVLYFYTPTTDLIAHCCMYNDNNSVLIKAYQILDDFIGRMNEELNPEITIFLSDHGMMNFKDVVKCSDHKVQREAFAARDEVLWLKNGYIAFEAHNGALLFTAHALKGTFVMAGKDIRHKRLEEMRTLDIYPTLLEALNVDVPEGRSGYVQDVFSRCVKNRHKLLPQNIVYTEIALIQCQQPNVTDIILNELYIEKRFSHITVVGEEKYREIYLNNPRVTNFVSYEKFKADNYDEVYCGIYNQTTEEMKHMRVK